MTLSEATMSDVEQLFQLIEASSAIVFFTGAGISTESGIPDFRGPQGIWKTTSPIYFSDFIASEDVRRKSWRGKFSGRDKMANAEPNDGHNAIARLYQRGKVISVITQNIDGLHQKSGLPDEKVIQLHGNSNYAACLSCDKRYELIDIKKKFLEDETLPICDECGGIVKTATISFGQPMPVSEMQRAEEATLRSDLFITAGSTVSVYPAAGFPRIAKQNGAKLVIVNDEPTDIDAFCDLVIHARIGPTFSAAVLERNL